MNQSQDILFQDDARQRLKAGIIKVSDAVKVTLGAKGRNVIIEQYGGEPIITKDGVSVARSIDLYDPIENMGARLIKSVAHRTNSDAGDGTTTATVLAQIIFTTGLKHLNSGASPMDLKRGIDKAVKVVVEKLKEISKPLTDLDDMARVATISANGDEEIGKNISEAIKKVSKDGVISIEEASGYETELSVVEGMQFPKGFLSPYFITDQSRNEAVLDKPLILLNNKRISLAQELIRALEISMELKRPLLILTDEIDSTALQILIINKVKGNVLVCAVKAPGYGSSRKDSMSDIAVLTGGTVVDDNLGMMLEDINIDQLGSATKAIISANSTTIIGGEGNKEEIKKRVEEIRSQIDHAPSPYDEERFKERLAKMAGGVAVIYVGGTSEVDMKERKDRFDDALNATRAAITEGIVPGGGVALLRCIKVLEDVKVKNEDEKLGVSIIKKAIEEPFRQIMRNAGLPEDVILNNVINVPNELVIDHGYNVATEEYELFFDTGVIDPTKVTRVALENAASVAGLLLTTECVVYNIKEKGEKE